MKKVFNLFLLVVLTLGITGCGNSKSVNKVISYLENKGYVCKNGTYNVGRIDEKVMEEATSCTYNEGKIEHQYIIRNKEKFEVQYVFVSNEYSSAQYSFKLAPYIILDMEYIILYKDGEKNGKYIHTGNSFNDGTAIIENYCNDDYYVKDKDYDKCGDLGDYLKDVNNAIDNFKKLYSSIGLEMR